MAKFERTISAKDKKKLKELRKQQENDKPLKGKKQAMAQELQKVQIQLMTQLIKRLSGKDKKVLEQFLQSGKAPGSKEYNALPKVVQGVVLKLNLKNVEVMRKYTINPFKIMQLKFSAWTFKKLGSTDTKSKKKKKKKKK